MTSLSLVPLVNVFIPRTSDGIYYQETNAILAKHPFLLTEWISLLPADFSMVSLIFFHGHLPHTFTLPAAASLFSSLFHSTCNWPIHGLTNCYSTTYWPPNSFMTYIVPTSDWSMASLTYTLPSADSSVDSLTDTLLASDSPMGILPNTWNCWLRMHRECRERFPRRVSDPDMHHGTCLTHGPWSMPGSLTSGFL